MIPETSKADFILSAEVTMANEQKHKRPKYNLEFKQDVKLILEKGYGQQQAADHLYISLSALGLWGSGALGSSV